MGRIITVILLGVGLFFAGAWQFGLLDSGPDIKTPDSRQVKTEISKLGADLYAAVDWPEIKPATRVGGMKVAIKSV